ncbi:MAG: hypothetical protein GY811_04025 [Myxococcales bacterium]|nr:hypothetical protein [Myxococcales bacterium]
MRFLDLRDCSNGRDRGLRHGAAFAGEIASLVELRIYLASRISGFTPAGLLSVAEIHLPILENFDSDLYEELLGLAEGAGRTPAEMVVLNQYTDIRDLDPKKWGEAGGAEKLPGDADYDGGCTMLWAQTDSGPVFAQTWDMHASAMPFVMMLRVSDAAGGDAYLLSLTGCMGMAGLNAGGLGLGINNLSSLDAQPGVVWSAIVRRALREQSTDAVRDLLLECEVGSGHHYLACNQDSVVSVETSGQRRKVVFTGEATDFVHSNHCLDSEIGASSRVPEFSTTHDRQEAMRASLDASPIVSIDDAWGRLGSHDGYPRSICTNMSTPEAPHAAATCAGIAMAPRGRRLYAVAGFTHNVKPEEFSF